MVQSLSAEKSHHDTRKTIHVLQNFIFCFIIILLVKNFIYSFYIQYCICSCNVLFPIRKKKSSLFQILTLFIYNPSAVPLSIPPLTESLPISLLSFASERVGFPLGIAWNWPIKSLRVKCIPYHCSQKRQPALCASGLGLAFWLVA